MNDYVSTMDTTTGVQGETNTEKDVKTYYRNLEDINLETTSNNLLLLGSYVAENPVLKETVSMVEFNMMQSSLSRDPVTATMDHE